MAKPARLSDDTGAGWSTDPQVWTAVGPGRSSGMVPSEVQRPTFELTIGPVIEQIPIARRFVRQVIHALVHGVEPTVVDNAELLASEAVSNAVVHGGTEVKVTVHPLGDMIRVLVHDDGRSPIPDPLDVTHTDPGGRGLAIINALAVSWGVDEVRDEGKALWFLVAPDATDRGVD